MYRDLRGRQRSAGTFATERQVNRAWQQAEAQLEAGRVGDPRRGRQTLKAFVENEWFPQPHVGHDPRELSGFDIAERTPWRSLLRSDHG
jgi:hypothetical protein